MAAQLALGLDNLEAVFAGADMTLADLVRLTLCTTDIDALFPHYATLTAAEGAAHYYAVIMRSPFNVPGARRDAGAVWAPADLQRNGRTSQAECRTVGHRFEEG